MKGDHAEQVGAVIRRFVEGERVWMTSTCGAEDRRPGLTTSKVSHDADLTLRRSTGRPKTSPLGAS